MVENEINIYEQKQREQEERGKLAFIVGIVFFIFVLIAVFLSLYFGQGPLLNRAVDELDDGPPIYMFSFYGNKANPMQSPAGVAVGPSGNVYVVDTDKKNVAVFNKDGKWLRDIGDSKNPPGGLRVPIYVAVDAKENIYVSDRAIGEIAVFNKDGKFTGEWDPLGEKNVAWCPLAMHFEGDRFFVSDVCFQKVTEFDNKTKKHQQKLRFGGEGPGTGQFAFPNGITLDEEDNIFVADSNNGRVQIFDKKGTYKQSIIMGGLPRGITFDSRNHLLVVDTVGHTVYGFDRFGSALFTFGTFGIGDGEFDFPNDVAVNSDGRIYVTDKVNKRVQVWEYR